jgi:hypothetical protein
VLIYNAAGDKLVTGPPGHLPRQDRVLFRATSRSFEPEEWERLDRCRTLSLSKAWSKSLSLLRSRRQIRRSRRGFCELASVRKQRAPAPVILSNSAEKVGSPYGLSPSADRCALPVAELHSRSLAANPSHLHRQWKARGFPSGAAAAFAQTRLLLQQQYDPTS